MTDLNPNIFKSFCELNQQLNAVEKEINNKSVSPQARENLHRQVEGIHSQLESLRLSAKATNEIAQSQFDEIDETEKRVVNLYRDIEDRFEEYEVSLIARDALCLSNDLENGEMEKVAKHVDALKYNIQYLLYHRRPSMKNRKIVHLAQELAAKAMAIMSGKLSVDDATKLHLVLMLRQLLNESLELGEMRPAEYDLGLAEELFEVAGLYYRREREEGRQKLKRVIHHLTEEEKAAFLTAVSTEERVRILLRASQRLAGGFSDEIDPDEVFRSQEGKAEIIPFAAAQA
jgi:hypothetical protein